MRRRPGDLRPAGRRPARAGDGTSAESLQAHAFVLMNEGGDTRATLALISDLPVLTLFDRNDQALLRLAITPDGPALAVTEGGKIRNHLDPQVEVLPGR